MPDTVVINPDVSTAIGEDKRLRWEGCLSIPGLRAAVPRAWRIRYEGVDNDGKPVGREVTGFHAGVVQHEYDHLDGILYPMRMRDFSLFGFTEELAARDGSARPGAIDTGHVMISPPERSPERDAAHRCGCCRVSQCKAGPYPPCAARFSIPAQIRRMRNCCFRAAPPT